MKKLLSTLLVLTTVLALLPAISVFGATENLLTNPGFEDGTHTGFEQYGAASKVEVSKEYAHSGQYGMLLSERSGKYATFAQDIADILVKNGPGEYTASMWAKLPEGETRTMKTHLTINIQSSLSSTSSYFNSGTKTLTHEWQQFVFKGKIEFDAKYGFKVALIYPQGFDGDVAPDIIVDDFSLVKTGAPNGIDPSEVITPAPGMVATPKPVTSTGKNLLTNPGFEDGDETGFEQYGADSTMLIGEEYAHTGDYGMSLESRMGKYATYSQDIADILTVNGPGEYLAYVWVKLSDSSPVEGNCQLVLNIKSNTDAKSRYFTSATKKLTTEWQQFAFKGNIDFDPKVGFEEARIYQQSYDGTDAPDIMIDDFYLEKLTEVNGIPLDQVVNPNDQYDPVDMTHISVAGEAREEKTTVGAIRWDAWYSHDGKDESIVSQVERSLSPKEYHFRAPFFANVTSSGKIEMPEYTQEIFDKEMEYAIEAGIDYFAYLWYDGAMGTAKKMHGTSKYKNDVKFVIIVDGNAMAKSSSRKEIIKLMQEDYYMTVLGGRPLMYYYTSNNEESIAATAKEIAYYRAAAAALNFPEPYAVVMNVGADKVQSVYGDAVSRYSFSGKSNITYQELKETAQKAWVSYQKSGSQYVPCLTFGWHAEPRYKNPVSWMTCAEDDWVPYPTQQEIGEHLAYALSYLDHPSTQASTKINTCIFYAWNEHDEGAWICPTIEVDENGNQLYNADGSKKINTTHLDAVKQAIKFYKAGKRVEVTVNGVSNNATDVFSMDADYSMATPTPLDENNTTDDKKSILPYIIIGAGAGVVIIGGAVAVIIIKKRGKKND